MRILQSIPLDYQNSKLGAHILSVLCRDANTFEPKSSKYFLGGFSTPLDYAIAYGYSDIVELLEENGASTK